MSKSRDYWAGYNEEVTRRAVRDLGGSYAEMARQVTRNLARDAAAKQRMLQGNPSLAYGLDAGELEQMSARELATHELKGYGIKVSDQSDPVEIRDAFHAGRMHERQRMMGGSAQDSSEDSVVSRYISET